MLNFKNSFGETALVKPSDINKSCRPKYSIVGKGGEFSQCCNATQFFIDKNPVYIRSVSIKPSHITNFNNHSLDVCVLLLNFLGFIFRRDNLREFIQMLGKRIHAKANARKYFISLYAFLYRLMWRLSGK